MNEYHHNNEKWIVLAVVACILLGYLMGRI